MSACRSSIPAAACPPDVAKRAIDPFFTTKDVGKGTGLGLSMAYGFARQTGGALEIMSEEGAGTRIDIYLAGDRGQALSRPQTVLDAGDAARRSQSGNGRERGLITIVDDDEGGAHDPRRHARRQRLSGRKFRLARDQRSTQADWAASEFACSIS